LGQDGEAGGSELPPVLLLGLGRMGSALAEGWAEQGLAPSYAVDPASGPSPRGITRVGAVGDLPPGFIPACTVLAVKPQVAALSVPGLARLAGGTVFLSIMAGQTLARLAALLGGRAAVVRAMPNTPAAIRRGITVACAGPGVTAEQRGLCDRLLRVAGAVAWTERESDLDPVTAISGGGPAYVFLLAELLEQAAIDQGLPGTLARALARQTIIGAGALLEADPADAATLRAAVTSPKGTTERALAVLTRTWPATIREAIDAATRRSRELGLV
jgi:pyrroline-5-carboxylate reductase